MIPSTQDAVLNFVEITKKGISVQTKSIIDRVKDGELKALDVKIKCKALEALTKELAKQLDPMARDEAETYGAKTFDHLGAKVELAETGTAYDYYACQDPVYNQLKVKLAEIQDQIKAREEVLKANKSKWIYVDEETGESFEVLPPVKTSNSSVKISFQ